MSDGGIKKGRRHFRLNLLLGFLTLPSGSPWIQLSPLKLEPCRRPGGALDRGHELCAVPEVWDLWAKPLNINNKPRQRVSTMCFGEHTICVGFPGGSGSKESACNMREGLIPGSRRSPGPEDPRVQKIPWRRVWQPTPVFLPGGLQSVGSPRVGHDWAT